MNFLEARQIVREIEYGDWFFIIEGKSTLPHTAFDMNMTQAQYEEYMVPDYLQIAFNAPCTTEGGEKSWTGRKWKLSEHMVKSELVMTAFKAVLTALEHEARELFRFQGAPIFGPHINVDILVEAYQRPDVLDVRKDKTNETQVVRESPRREVEVQPV